MTKEQEEQIYSLIAGMAIVLIGNKGAEYVAENITKKIKEILEDEEI